tara:strand:+ start:106 stop:258 length:153 start_codon:yes stop_codon:yes gene_type:complete
MNSLKKWLKNLFESMGLAFVHPLKNSLPPNIGTHSYSQKSYKKQRKVWYG